jgi:UPF0716 protein FxsA
MWLFAIFVVVPLIEIALFIQVGGWLTLWPTLGIVLLTGMLGSLLMRQQGLRVLEQLRRSGPDMQNPLSPLAHGALILLAGILLLTPGFFTDAIGFALMVPPVRAFVIKSLGSRIHVVGVAPQPTANRNNDVIDGEFEEVTPRPGQKPSGWTEH